MKEHKANVDCFFIAHGPAVHYGGLTAGQVVMTGQDNLEIYQTEEEHHARLKDFGIIIETEEAPPGGEDDIS